MEVVREIQVNSFAFVFGGLRVATKLPKVRIICTNLHQTVPDLKLCFSGCWGRQFQGYRERVLLTVC